MPSAKREGSVWRLRPEGRAEREAQRPVKRGFEPECLKTLLRASASETSDGAEERIRTSTGFPPPAPQAGASAVPPLPQVGGINPVESFSGELRIRLASRLSVTSVRSQVPESVWPPVQVPVLSTLVLPARLQAAWLLSPPEWPAPVSLPVVAGHR